MEEYMPLEKITNEPNIIKNGSLFLLRKVSKSDFGGPREIIEPVFYGGLDSYVHEEPSRVQNFDKLPIEGSFAMDAKTNGIRVYHSIIDGKLVPDISLKNHLFYDEKKGLFIPFRKDNIKYSFKKNH